MYREARHLKIAVWLGISLTLCLLTTPAKASSDASSEDAAVKEIKAKNKLAEKLMKLSKQVSVKEARYPESSSGGGAQDFDRNTGNPFKANTTYHSYVWDYCMQWQGPNNCQKWLDPYVSIHGIEGEADQSPLEGAMAKHWQKMKKPGETGAGGSYGIWDVKSKGQGSLLDEQGRLDRTKLTQLSLKKEVSNDAEDIGYDTADKEISVTYNEDAPKNEMPNMESLRLMAGRWTRMFRNRLVSIIGELRAADKGIEFALGEDSPDCSAYLGWMKTDQEETKIEERLQPQAQLDMETRTLDLQNRYQKCMKVRNASVAMVNAKMEGDKVVSGGKEGEQIDKWRSRVNIATIDYGGIDPNSVPKPSDAQLTEEETKGKIGEWNDGGTKMQVTQVSNGDQIESFNGQLRVAAKGMKEMAAVSPAFIDTSAQILENQISIGSKSLVEINGLTKEMRMELQGTQMPRVGGNSSDSPQPNPDTTLEDTPSQLTFTSSAK